MILKWCIIMPTATKAVCVATVGRCLVKFAYHSGIVEQQYHFIATDGEHEAEININGTVN